MNFHSFEVRELIGEYDFITKQLYQTNDVSKLMLEIAKVCKNNAEAQTGLTLFMATALRSTWAKQ